jgi:hypothetical protein
VTALEALERLYREAMDGQSSPIVRAEIINARDAVRAALEVGADAVKVLVDDHVTRAAGADR